MKRYSFNNVGIGMLSAGVFLLLISFFFGDDRGFFIVFGLVFIAIGIFLNIKNKPNDKNDSNQNNNTPIVQKSDQPYSKSIKPAVAKSTSDVGEAKNQSLHNNISDKKPIQKIQQKEITYSDLDFNKVVHRYLSSSHSSVPCEYDYYKYLRAEFDCMLMNLSSAEVKLSDKKVLRQNAVDFYYKSKNITARTPIKNIKDFIVIDTETTGLKPGGNDILEITAIKFLNFKPTEIFTTLLKPRKHIPAEATEINGITDEMVENSPKFSQIYESLISFIEEYPLVMHNARFDLKFLFVSGVTIDPEKRAIYDTLELSKRCIKETDDTNLESYKLVDVCEEVDIFFDGAHRSAADALATGLLFNEIVKIKRDIPDLTKIL